MANRNGWSTDEMNESLLMQENQARADRMAQKVGLLKSFAIDIDRETREQNRYLDGMQSTFESAGGLLGGSLGRVLGISKNTKNNRTLCCYIILASIVLFFLFYYVISWLVRATSSATSVKP